MQKNNLYTHFIVILAFSGLCALGLWQLKRLEYKNHFINQINANIQTKPQIMDAIDSIDLYNKTLLTGKFLPNKYVFLYGRRTANDEKDGYYFLSPFLTNNNQIFLVLRAWIPYSLKEKLNNYVSPQNETITVITMPSEKKPFFVPKNDLEKNIWFTLDCNEAAEYLGALKTDFYFMQIDGKYLPTGSKPLSTKHLSKIRNDHFEYAITWFSLAICLLVMYIYYCKTRKFK